MTSGAVARRYATALFEVVEAAGLTDRALADMAGMRRLIAEHAELRKVFETPAIPAGRKKALVEALAARAAGMTPEVTRLLGLLAERDRLAMLEEVAVAFEARVNEARRIVPAEVVTAAPLETTLRAAIEGALAKATGSDVRLTERVDPALVGGLVARVGSLVFDGSVTRQIERLRQRLLTGA